MEDKASWYQLASLKMIFSGKKKQQDACLANFDDPLYNEVFGINSKGCFMKKFFLIFIIALSMGFPHAYGEEHRYIVKFKSNSKTKRTASPITDAPKGHVIRSLKNGYVINLNEALDIKSILEDKEVESVEQDRLMHLIEPTSIIPVKSNIENEEKIPNGVKRIKADTGDIYPEMTVAVIDTGVDPNIPDIDVVLGINFINSSKAQTDDNGHGTHVAGTIAAKINGRGVVGVAPGTKVIALKVLDAKGSGWMSDIIAAIEWVTEHADQIDVVNMSLGDLGNGTFMHEAIQKSVNKGIVYVVAAGNSSMDIYGHNRNYFKGSNFFPASYPEVMTVSAMTDTDGKPGGNGPKSSYGELDDTLAWFSNFSTAVHPDNPVYSPGAGIDLAAPGVDILSNAPGDKLMKMSGTSIACPHAAGAVIRFISEYGEEYMENGKKDAQFVYKIRQALIDLAQPQEEWNDNHDASDPDSNHEGLLQVP
ncbi:Subtilisin amylosacchariticus [Waddlia chondrophila 2032/99]|uniref:Subtilisin amylosacchariticus n=1 Tax=Waddlia chondrophila 2032/99 TaxID=765953 RepID=F8LDU0_9BACT|nr:Subtilisin amylosacchariticus [Waddlia chondrophila 2032/99]